MPDRTPKIPDDPWLIKAFTEYEHMPKVNRADMEWSITTEFQVFSEFLIKDIRDIRARLKNADDAYLYYVCEHIFNIIDWMTLIVVDTGAAKFALAFEDVFEKEFGERRILQNTYDDCFAKWLAHKSGQQQIGLNSYTILGGRLYYRDRFRQWFEVDTATAFDIRPKKNPIDDVALIEKLDGEYQETWYDAILRKWEEKGYHGTLPDDFMQFMDEETSPEAYSDFTMPRIQKLLKEPVSVAELERWNGGKIGDLEDIIKIGALVLELVKKRRADDGHTIYLLRDCLVFYEIHEALDILMAEDTSPDHLLIGRKLLSQKSKEWGYYILLIMSLYEAHRRYPANFKEFYNDYARLLDMFASLNPRFAAIVADLADYIKEHTRTDRNKVVIFDIGFQGSIALLSKYILDRHIHPTGPKGNIETEIKVGVGAVWSKELFGGRYEGDYFPFLNRLQLLARSNDLYHYKADSLRSGQLRVLMGDKDKQHKAAIELVVLMMVTLVGQAE